MSKKRNRRQRKKLRVGEYREFGFEVSARIVHPLGDGQRDALLDAFLEECVEPNGMLFGGGINESLEGFIVANSPRDSATDEQRECVRQWMAQRAEFASVHISPLIDAWHMTA